MLIHSLSRTIREHKWVCVCVCVCVSGLAPLSAGETLIEIRPYKCENVRVDKTESADKFSVHVAISDRLLSSVKSARLRAQPK